MVSPRALKTSTFGDEIKNAGVPSKIIAIALKDRAAIVLGGHRADMALWMDYKNFQWQTSSYYGPAIPSWAAMVNAELRVADRQEKTWKGQKIRLLSKQGLSLSYGVDVTFDLAEKALSAEKMGQGDGTDLLAISLSSHDMLGHRFGPNSQEIQDLTVYEDQRLAQFFSKLKKHLGSLDKVTIVLTADHGIAPTVEYAAKAKFEAGRLDYLQMYRAVNESLDKKFGAPKNKEWIVASKDLNFYLNRETLKEKDLPSAAVEAEVKKVLSALDGVLTVVTKSEVEKGLYPPGELGQQVQRQYVPGKSGDVMLIPRPFFMEKDDNVVNHLTGFSYDRTVPLVFFGRKFKAGVYSQTAKVIDIAPTLTFSVGVLPPATNEGKVLPIFE